MSRGLTEVSRADLEALLGEVDAGRLVCPMTDSGLMAAGLGHLAESLGVLEGLGTEAVVAAVRVALAERERRPRTSLELVWTGPEARGSTTRDTAVVVRRLFESAQRSVLIAGYSIDHGAELLRPLHEAMVERGVEARFFLNLEGDARTELERDRTAARAVDRFLDENWPFGEPWPDISYDPRSLTYGAGASLHAKVIVVDERLTLIGSANLTDRGQTRNVEAGVLIDDEPFAARLFEQWRGLRAAGLLRSPRT